MAEIRSDVSLTIMIITATVRETHSIFYDTYVYSRYENEDNWFFFFFCLVFDELIIYINGRESLSCLVTGSLFVADFFFFCVHGSPVKSRPETSDDKRQLLTVHILGIYQDHLTGRRGSLSRQRLIIPRCVPPHMNVPLV